MQDEQEIERYRRMTPQERLDLWRELTNLAWSLWEANLEPAEIQRRWRIWRSEHDASDRAMLEGFRKAQ